MSLPALPRVYTLTQQLNSNKLLFIVGQWPTTTLLTSNFLDLKSAPQFPLPLDAQFFLAEESAPTHSWNTNVELKPSRKQPDCLRPIPL